MKLQTLVLRDGRKVGGQVAHNVVDRKHAYIWLQGSCIKLGNVEQGADDLFSCAE